MGIETKHDLTDATIAKLQDLIRINLDSEQGFDEAAQKIQDANIANVFREISSKRAQNVAELQDFVTWNGEQPTDEGSYAAALHRIWMDLRAKINGGDKHVILSEAERGEDQIKHAYEETLKETAGSAMNDVLTRQYAGVKAGHDRIRGLRNRYAESK